MKKRNLPVGLFNGTVATSNGLFQISDIDIDTAKNHIRNNGFISAIGHQATADIMSDLLGMDIPMNRIQFHQEIGKLVIVFKLNERPDVILTYTKPGKTIAFIGSSGVGKSTLINRLIGQDILATKQIREDDDKSRHVTTHRHELALGCKYKKCAHSNEPGCAIRQAFKQIKCNKER